MRLTLPTNSEDRKKVPIRTGCLDYFPAAIAGVAAHSVAGNDKHNPGEPLHHSRGKSADHADCIDRHLSDIADMVADFERSPQVHASVFFTAILEEANAMAWRALALSQELHERFGGAPLAPRARLPATPRAVSRLDCPPPAGADGLAKALGRAAQVAAGGPSRRDDSAGQWNPADQGECEDVPTPLGSPSERPSRR